MKPPPSYAITSAQRTWNTNSYHYISTNGMPPNAPSVPSRTISLPVSRVRTSTSPFRTGAASYPRPNSPLISSTPLTSIPNFRPMPNSRVPLISHAHPSHPQETESSSTKNPPTAKLGPHMAWMAGTLTQPSTIINAIASGYHAPTPNASSKPSLSSQKPSHFHKDAAIQAARELTHALQQPRFRGPLAQFHDDHLTLLRELSKSSTPLLRGWKTSLRGWTPPSTNSCHQYLCSHQRQTLPKLLFNPSTNFHITYARARPVHITSPPSHTVKPAS